MRWADGDKGQKMHDWGRMGEAIEARRKELDLTKAALARRARIDPSTLHHAVKGSRRGPASYEAVERALNWPTGTLDRIGQGGEPPAGVLDDAARLQRIEARADRQELALRELSDRHAELVGKVTALRDQVADLARRNGNDEPPERKTPP